MTDEFYSPDDLLAFQRVGEFLCWFSMLESNIDAAIIELLSLDPLAGRLLLSYVPFARKGEFLIELMCQSHVGLDDAQKKQV